jgi:uncharacterized protein
MAQNTDILDLGRLGLSSGEARHLDLTVAIDDVALAGQSYAAAPARVPVRVDVARMLGGYHLRMRFSTRLEGPCMRCLDDAARSFAIDAREVDQPGGGSEDLDSPYVDGEELDLHAWARDALVLELPAQILCTADCKGICAVCGENLNGAAPDHGHAKEPDGRWAKLSELKFE